MTDWTEAELLALYRTWSVRDLVVLRHALKLDAAAGDEHVEAFCKRRLRAIDIVMREVEQRGSV